MHIIISHTYSTNARVTLNCTCNIWTSGGLSVDCTLTILHFSAFINLWSMHLEEYYSSLPDYLVCPHIVRYQILNVLLQSLISGFQRKLLHYFAYRFCIRHLH